MADDVSRFLTDFYRELPEEKDRYAEGEGISNKDRAVRLAQEATVKAVLASQKTRRSNVPSWAVSELGSMVNHAHDMSKNGHHRQAADAHDKATGLHMKKYDETKSQIHRDAAGLHFDAKRAHDKAARLNEGLRN